MKKLITMLTLLTLTLVLTTSCSLDQIIYDDSTQSFESTFSTINTEAKITENNDVVHEDDTAQQYDETFAEVDDTINTQSEITIENSTSQADEVVSLDENGTYTSKDDVALYIHLYGRLPSNFITKKEAEALGWTGGSLEKYAAGKCIGGSYFGNYEGILPEAKGRKYTECDIDTLGSKSRGAKRIVFSNDGLIYYTDDHYESFELLYEGE